jgi:hypothetical protein
MINFKNNLGTYQVENLNMIRDSIKKIMDGTYNIEYCDICSVQTHPVDENTVHVAFKFVHHTVPTMATEPFWLITLTTQYSSVDSCMANYLLKNRKMDNMIVIEEMTDVIDNWGKTETTTDADEIAKVLNDSETWTDDISFKDRMGSIYSIDDLLQKTVIVGSHTILVIE